MDYQIDLDPTHRVLRTTITAAVLTEELLDDSYQVLSLVASRGGPYAAIFDFSGVTATTLSSDAIRDFALRAPAVPEGKTCVVAAKEPLIFGSARMVQLNRDFLAEQFHVVRSLEEAYETVGVRAEDFTERLFPKDLAA
jgi:hypothetical protein